MKKKDEINRRDFFKKGSAGVAGAGLLVSSIGAEQKKLDKDLMEKFKKIQEFNVWRVFKIFDGHESDFKKCLTKDEWVVLEKFFMCFKNYFKVFLMLADKIK